MKKLNSRHKGFTLLELLLVLALMAILAIGGLGIYQIQLRNFKVDKTSLQMQQWLQAGMAFYVDCGKWPADSNTDPNILSAMMGQSPLTSTECPAFANKVRAYMPAGSDVSGPFPNSYQIGAFGPSLNMFQVSTYLPGSVTTVAFVGNMIAGRLPNATAKVDLIKNPPQVLVQATVNVPGQAITGQSFIVAMQNVYSTTLSNIPVAYTCPSGMKYVTYYALSGVDVGNRPASVNDSVLQSIEQKNGFLFPTVGTKDSGTGGKIKTGGLNQVLLITACVPMTSSSNAAQNIPDANLRY